jgi:hypothetical protein
MRRRNSNSCNYSQLQQTTFRRTLDAVVYPDPAAFDLLSATSTPW